MAAFITAVLIGLGTLRVPSIPVEAAGEDPPREKEVTRGLPPELVTNYERALAGWDDRLMVLAKLVLEDVDSFNRARQHGLDLEMKARTAEAAYLNAKLEREVAEIALKEYTLGTAVSERAAAEGVVQVAKDGVERARRSTAEARERLARITALTDNSAVGLNLDYLYTDRLSAGELQEKRAALELEQAESKKQILIQYEINRRTRELEAQVKQAHSQELARQAEWEIAKARLERARQEGQARELSDDRKRILALIQQSIRIEEQMCNKLAMLGMAGQPTAEMQHELHGLAGELAALIAKAESQRAAGDLARIKPRIQQAARRYPATAPK